jgi:hypothetical protein
VIYHIYPDRGGGSWLYGVVLLAKRKYMKQPQYREVVLTMGMAIAYKIIRDIME